MRLIPGSCSFAIVAALVAAAPAAAQEWRTAPDVGAKLGIRAIACKGEFCVGVACGRGGPELVAIAAGGGPFNGPTDVVVGQARGVVVFREDEALTQAFGMIGARAPAPPPMMAAMAQAKEIALSGPTYSDPIKMRFGLKGYSALASDVARGCAP